MDKLFLCRQTIAAELTQYKTLFNETLQHKDDFLGQALQHIQRRQGKMMRPILVLLMAKELGEIKCDSIRSAVTLELLHTASLIHDDVVDESKERRGQQSANAIYDNKIAVLLGDFLLSKSLLMASQTNNKRIVEIISSLGGTLSEGEIFQLATVRNEDILEDSYFRVIDHKTAALFEACAQLGVISANGSDEYEQIAQKFGHLMGICFQIRDDIFDYFENQAIGKPTGNDMAEGKLTLPAIYAVNSTHRTDVQQWARRVKQGQATSSDITSLIDFTKQVGGIEYAKNRMEEYYKKALSLLTYWKNTDVRSSLKNYLDFVVERTV